MRDMFTNQVVTLQPGQAVSGMTGQPRTLRIERGRVWITVEGISHDYFLHAGDSFTTIPNRLVVLEAKRETRVDARRPARLPSWRKLLVNVLQRLRPAPTVQVRMHHACCNAR